MLTPPSPDAYNTATRALLDNIARAGFPPVHTLPIEQARLSYRMGIGASQIAKVELPRVEDFSIPGPAGSIAARLWAPSQDPHLPVLLYLHGGGFLIGSIDTCEPMCRTVAAQSGAAVVAIDYRLAPEHKYPACLDDAWAALQWLAHEGTSLGLDRQRIAVGGDSAGGHLAAAAALMARDAGLPLRLQALFYPTVQNTLMTDSFKAFAGGSVLNVQTLSWFEAQSKDAAKADDPRRQPLFAASHVGLAPAWIGLAECDPLADDGRLYAQALRKAGVAAEVVEWPGTVHDFINMGRFLPEAAQAHTALAKALQHALA
jgi:acetyl esterase